MWVADEVVLGTEVVMNRVGAVDTVRIITGTVANVGLGLN